MNPLDIAAVDVFHPRSRRASEIYRGSLVFLGLVLGVDVQPVPFSTRIYCCDTIALAVSLTEGGVALKGRVTHMLAHLQNRPDLSPFGHCHVGFRARSAKPTGSTLKLS